MTWQRKMPNTYQIEDDCAILFIHKRNGERLRVLIDQEDVEVLKDWHWHVIGLKNKPYVRGRHTATGYKSLALHRIVMRCPENLQVDHINHDILDNRKRNLRIVTAGQNQQNLKGARTKSSSGVRGIHYSKRSRCWIGQIRVDKKCVWLKHFRDLETAATIIREKRLELMPFATS